MEKKKNHWLSLYADRALATTQPASRNDGTDFQRQETTDICVRSTQEDQRCFCKRIAIGKHSDSFSLLVGEVFSGLPDTRGRSFSWVGYAVVRSVWKM